MSNIRLSALTALIAGISLVPAVHAASPVTQRCVVVDPARSALTVRATPTGGDAGRLHNGQVVEMIDISYDEKGRPWAHIRTADSGTGVVTGWVFREFLECD